MATCRVSDLQVGQRFSWIPAAWFGPCELLSTTRRSVWDVKKGYAVYDLKYSAAVVNPPGVAYGVPANTRVRLLAPKRPRSTPPASR